MTRALEPSSRRLTFMIMLRAARFEALAREGDKAVGSAAESRM
jgi:hypothetical protein